ncbi:MAG: hypothetical protein NUV47_01795 [Patescibacteria group bacterium]|nr:hypothetical protein [Patescibacteria group bacterium]
MKYNKGFIGIGVIVAIIAALAVGGGVVYYATKTPAPSSNTEENNYQPQANQVQQQINTQTPQVAAPKSETANWKTIKDSFNEVTYEFKLLSDFEPRSANPEIWRFFSNNKYQFEIFIHPERSEFSLEKTLADMDAVGNTVGEGGPRVLSKQNIIVDGLPAIQRKQNVIYNPESSAQTVTTYLLVNRHLVALTIKSKIDINSDPEIFQAPTLTTSDIEFYSKILSTFKFK